MTFEICYDIIVLLNNIEFMNYIIQEQINLFEKSHPNIDYNINIDLDFYQTLEDKSYLYKWTNLKNEEIYSNTGTECLIYYIGYNTKQQCLPHEATDIPYFFSSKFQDFKIDFYKSDSRWRLDIISIPTMPKGKNREMEWEEYFMLLAADNGKGAMRSNLYYNNHNGGIMNKDTEKVFNLIKCKKLIKMINDDTVFPIEEKDKDLLRDIEDFQGCREETFQDQIQQITYEVNLAGSLINTDPYIVFKGKAKSGGDLGVGGIHTKRGVLNSESVQMKTKLIPNSLVKDLTDPETRFVVMALNPQPLKFRKIPPSSNAVKILVDNYISDKIEAKDPINPIQVKEWGYTKINPIIDWAEKEIKIIKEDEGNQQANRQRLLYDIPQYNKKGQLNHPEGRQEELNQILDSYNLKKDDNEELISTDIIAIGFSVGAPKSAVVKVLDISIERKEIHGIKEINKVILVPYGTKAEQLHEYDSVVNNDGLTDKDILYKRIQHIFPKAKIRTVPIPEWGFPDVI